MSEISDTARTSILIADFANVDASGKLNLLGGGVAITAIDSRSGTTAPLTLVVISSVDPRFIGEDYAIEVGLYSNDGQLVVPPGPVEGAQPIRFGRPVTVEPLRAPQGSYIPPGSVWPSTQLILNFQNGLPLATGRGYEWRVSIDGNVTRVANLLVAGPPPVTYG
jgi:hypothetical protein